MEIKGMIKSMRNSAQGSDYHEITVQGTGHQFIGGKDFVLYGTFVLDVPKGVCKDFRIGSVFTFQMTAD